MVCVNVSNHLHPNHPLITPPNQQNSPAGPEFRTFGSRPARRAAGFGFEPAPWLWLVLLCACWLWASPLLADTGIVVLQSHDSLPYQQAVQGFQSSLSLTQSDAVYHRYIVDNPGDTQTVANILQAYPAKLLLTLGTPATRAALALENRPPLVAALMLDMEEVRQSAGTTGVGLSFSAQVQWLWLRRLMPDARQIAVIYDPRQGDELYQALAQLARADGVNLTPAPAAAAEDLPLLLKSLPSQLDAIWGLDGAVAFNAAVVRELLLYSFRNRAPLIGLSAQWVKAGALYALDWDYADIGAQSAELAATILQNNTPAFVLPPPQTPRKIRPVCNLKTAGHMKLPIDDRWLPQMAEVFR